MKAQKRGLFEIIPRWCITAALCLLSYVATPSFAECLRDNGDGTLTDPNTGLIWQACAVGQIWDGKSCMGDAKQLNWLDALLAADSDRFLGKIDWILPTKVQWEGVLGTHSHCKQWDGSWWSSSPYAGLSNNYAWYVNFDQGYVEGHPRLNGVAVWLVRASQLSDIGVFKASLILFEERRKAKLAGEQAKRANTIAAYTQFIKDYPDVAEAPLEVWQLIYEPVKRANTVAAYTQFIHDNPGAPLVSEARSAMRQAAYELAKRANTVAAYTDLLKKYPDSSQASEARVQIRTHLESPIRKAESAFKCEEARQLDQHFEAAGMSSLFNFDSCVDNRKFNNILTSRDSNKMYLSAVKYQNNDELGRAKRLYLEIMERFEDNAIALKAADRLAGLKEVEAVVRSNSATRRAVEQSEAETRQSVEQASRDADNRQRRSKSEFCSGKSSCFGGCSGLSSDASNRCYSSCNSRFAGC